MLLGAGAVDYRHLFDSAVGEGGGETPKLYDVKFFANSLFAVKHYTM